MENQMCRKVNTLSIIERSNFFHSMPTADVMNTLMEIRSNDTPYCLYMNNPVAKHWGKLMGNNVELIEPSLIEESVNERRNFLCKRVSSIITELNDESFDEKERKELTSFIIANVSSFSLISEVINKLMKYEIDHCYEPFTYYISQILIPFKLHDYVYTAETFRDLKYAEIIYQRFLKFASEDVYDKASTEFEKFCNYMRVSPDIKERFWKDRMQDVDFCPEVQYDHDGMKQVEMNTMLKVLDNVKKASCDITEESVNAIMEELFPGRKMKVSFKIPENAIMELATSDAQIGTVMNEKGESRTIAKFNNDENNFTLFTTERANSYVFGYDPLSDDLTVRKLESAKDDFKFEE